MVLPIVHYGDPILRKKGKPVERFDEELVRLASNMVETMYEAEGIGLAAQQVGRDLQFCVVDVRDAESKLTYQLDGVSPPLDLIMPMALANPVVEAVLKPTTVYEEGCLSFPGIRGDVVRPDVITVKFKDVHGEPHELTCNGLLSRCIQHEVDHLNGVLFIEHMTKSVLASLEADLRKLKKQTQKSRQTSIL
ncbi:MAG TPA: peptide deformylase [Opitutaceae bacterium]